MNLKGKVALITGASKGIGKSIAVEFSRQGAIVAVNYNKDREGAEETLGLIKDNGGFGNILQGDVSSYAGAETLVQNVIKNFGKLDILVNNAGISKVGLFMDMTEADWDSLMNTNLKGVFNCSHNAIKHMISQRSGSIINISSIWGNVGASCETIYSASKGGINAFTRALAKEIASSGIRVNAIAPGLINTEMNKWLSTEEREALKQEIPMLKLGEGEDIGKLAAFLCSEGAKYITGQVITVDGGML